MYTINHYSLKLGLQGRGAKRGNQLHRWWLHSRVAMVTKLALDVVKLLLLLNWVIPKLLTQHLCIERRIHRVSYGGRLLSPVPSTAAATRGKADESHLHL